MAEMVDREYLLSDWAVSPSVDEHIAKIEKYAKMGFTKIDFLSYSPDDEYFIRFYAQKVIPYFKGSIKE